MRSFLRFTSNASSSTSGVSMEVIEEMMKLREKCKHFRVLIIGRANAGKTTVLQKICNTSEQPSIQDRKGKLVPISTLSPSDKRGLHDIEQELIFPNNPNFLFHDSRGIEAGGKDELELVKQFIAKRASAKKLEDRIHVIWYCIPVDNDRILTEAEKAFFENIGSGGDANNSEQLSHNIPVIAIFTKFDHLEIDAFTILQDEGLDEDEALKEAPHRAKSDFERDHLPRLLNCKNRPQSHIYLREMHETNTSIAPLAEVTAEVLESTVLKLVFVSSQKSSIALCARYAVEQVISPWFIEYRKKSFHGPPPLTTQQDLYRLSCHVLVWFPYDLNDRASEYSKHGGYGLGSQATDLKEELDKLAGPHPSTNRILRLGTALCLIAAHSYSFPSFRRRLNQALEVYIQSGAKAVEEGVLKIAAAYPNGSKLSSELIDFIALHPLDGQI